MLDAETEKLINEIMMIQTTFVSTLERSLFAMALQKK